MTINLHAPGLCIAVKVQQLPRFLWPFLFAFFFYSFEGLAQSKVKGTIRSVEGPLAGANVKVKGTTVTTATDASGNFSISASPRSVLEVTYTGYKMVEVGVNNRMTVSILLEEDQREMNEVVVTALGIKRERKALGYSVTEVKGETLTQARETNIGNSLVGKVAGLNVSSVSGGPGAAVNIQIRGMSSITQSNQPLYVINGVPMSNETSSGRGQFQNAPDRGDNIGNLNPDDIESISVLKGAAASALYGSRAKAGVILITTKRGQANAPASIELNSNFVAEQVRDQTDFQYEYGQGTMALVNGAVVMNRPVTIPQAMTGSSWGPRMDGQMALQADGVMRPYSPARNNVANFYRTGQTFTNTLAFTKGFDQGSVRVSATNLDNTSIMPNSGLDRQSFSIAANYMIAKGLSLDVRNNYILEQAKNRPMLGDNAGSAAAGIFNLATSVNVNDFKDPNPDGTEKNLTNSFQTNPWFAAKYFVNNTNRNRMITSATLRYAMENGFFVQGRVARDYYNDRFKQVVPNGTAYQPNGSIQEQSYKFSEINADVLAGKTFNIGRDVTLTPNIGASYRNIKDESINASGAGFSVPYVYYLGNVPTRTVSYNMREWETQAVYGTMEFSFHDFLYLTGSARTDWFSTLATPGKDNRLDKFYPSISGSFVFNEFLQDLSWLSFGKLRAGYAVVGQATDAYQTQLTYNLNALSVGSLPLGQISNAAVPNASLRASQATELEAGTEMRLFNDRLSLDLTWYQKISTNEIVSAPTSVTSGYSSAVLNIGKLKNTGFEGLISAYPVKHANGITWNTSLNGTINKNEIIALAPGNAPLLWATARSATAFVQHIVGLPAGQLMAYDYARDKDGKIQVNPNTGLALRSTVLTPQGSVNPQWLAGWTNEFTYKRFNLGFLIDGKFGGKIYSNTESASTANGRNKITLEGRDKIYGNNQTAQAYWSNLGSISALYVLDASFIKFRQAIIGYSFRTGILGNRVKTLNLSAVGRNLFTIMKRTKNIDPEAAYSGDATGLEMGLLPPTRTFGVNLSAKF